MKPGTPTGDDLRAALLALVPDETRVTTSESVLDQHAEDFSFHRPHRPDAVVYPTSVAEVASVLEFASEHRVPLVPFGVGTSLEGHVVPVNGGISLDLTRMDRILELRTADLTATVEAGVTRLQLNRSAGEHGLFFPVDPGADATVGGMAATNASGTTTVRYGKMRAQILALEVVLADGRVVRTGSSAPKTSAGYDLTGLFVGSEGTLGVITELTLRLYGIPEHTVAARLAFPDLGAACRTAVGIIAAGLPVSRLELLDEWTMQLMNSYKGTRFPEAPALFVELSGSRAAVEGDVPFLRELAESGGCAGFEPESDPTARAKIWEARHEAVYALMATAPGKKPKATDVCVPVSQLPAAIEHARRTLDELGLEGAIHGHVGDGNYHVALMVDSGDPDELERLQRLDEALIADALVRGGTCTGEHGVGLGKRKYLEREHGDLLPLMRGVKAALDPLAILNPGKLWFETEARASGHRPTRAAPARPPSSPRRPEARRR